MIRLLVSTPGLFQAWNIDTLPRGEPQGRHSETVGELKSSRVQEFMNQSTQYDHKLGWHQNSSKHTRPKKIHRAPRAPKGSQGPWPQGGQGHPGRATETQGKARGPPGSPGYPFPGFPLGPPGPPWVPLASKKEKMGSTFNERRLFFPGSRRSLSLIHI